MEAKAVEVRNDGAVIIGAGRNKRVIATEDVCTLPQSDLARVAVRSEHGLSGSDRQLRNIPVALVLF